ncbi:hypothetical protein Sango_1237800 [Sesamum angolense]|uniref:Uncharacterized protein n=1 Tax=Sesamum angolense TaxID=2727404 RepID=A0AAE2BU37_9LAMI|nr:hypothetical protein Sango_1237800 [Sesamum angolense]
MVAEVKDMKITMVVKERASSDEVEIVHCVTEYELWKSEIEEKLIKGTEPGDQIAAKGLKFRVNRFTILNVELYRRSTEGPLLKCISPEKAHFVLREIPKVSYTNNSGRRSLAQKIACPFDQWGIDILGPFPPASGQKKFNMVAVEYCSKWVEAEASTKVSKNKGCSPTEFYTFSKKIIQNSIRKNLDLIEELREKAFLHIQRYKNTMINAHNRRVKSRFPSWRLSIAKGRHPETKGETGPRLRMTIQSYWSNSSSGALGASSPLHSEGPSFRMSPSVGMGYATSGGGLSPPPRPFLRCPNSLLLLIFHKAPSPITLQVLMAFIIIGKIEPGLISYRFDLLCLVLLQCNDLHL